MTNIKLMTKPKSEAVEDQQNILEKIGLVAGAFLLYLVAFRINQTLDEYVLYAQGVALVFLPAGIKHISILIGRFWGALGCFLALAYVTPEFWTDIEFEEVLHYSAISTLATLIAIQVGMKIFSIQSDLGNLRLIHLPLLDLIATLTHSFATNAYFIYEGMKLTDSYIANAIGMAFGDFTGSIIMMMLLFIGLQIKKQTQASA